MEWIAQHRWLVRWSLLIYCLLLITSTHLPPQAMPNTHVSDKIEHFTAYAILACLLELSLLPRQRRSVPLIAIITWSIVLVYGAVDEITQPFTHRTCDIHDWYCDASGATLAIICITAICWMSWRKASVSAA